MYLYDELDRTLVTERVAEFRDQVGRRLSGELTEDEFRPLRLMNGVYLQLHAYMLRIAIPYGTLSTAQMRMLAHVARRYDRNFGHFTTRQNIQFHWIKLEELPDAMADLASVDLHGMQTSGNCVRNITTDQWAGVAPDEIEDPLAEGDCVRPRLHEPRIDPSERAPERCGVVARTGVLEPGQREADLVAVAGTLIRIERVHPAAPKRSARPRNDRASEVRQFNDDSAAATCASLQIYDAARHTLFAAHAIPKILFCGHAVGAGVFQQGVVVDRRNRRKIAVRDEFRPGELGDVVRAGA